MASGEGAAPHTVDEFLVPLRKGFASERHFDPEAAFREVVEVMRMHVSAGEMEDVRRVMPDELKRLWAEDVWPAR